MYEKQLSFREIAMEEARQAGYMGLRAMQEAQVLEYLPWEEQESVELISGPRESKSFVAVEDIPADTPMTTVGEDDGVSLFEAAEEQADRAWRKRMRDAFFERLEASRAVQARLCDLADEARSKADLYTVLGEALAFDESTPAWMFSVEGCQAWDLRPIKSMDELIMPAVERAERYLERAETRRKHARDAFFARLEASQALQAELVERACRAANRADLYALLDAALLFDNFTPAWMASDEACRVFDLRPLAPLDRLILPAIERAERRLAGRAKRACGSANPKAQPVRPPTRREANMAFVPVMMKNGRGAGTIAYTAAYMERKLQEGYQVTGCAA